MARYGKPDVFNTDQGPQFTDAAFTSLLARNGITISMDGKGAWRDNVVRRATVARSVKYEEVFCTQCRPRLARPIPALLQHSEAHIRASTA